MTLMAWIFLSTALLLTAVFVFLYMRLQNQQKVELLNLEAKNTELSLQHEQVVASHEQSIEQLESTHKLKVEQAEASHKQTLEQLESKNSELSSNNEKLNSTLEEKNHKLMELEKDSSRLHSENESLKNSLNEVKELRNEFQQNMSTKFEQMAVKVLDERSEGYRQQSQAGLNQVLNPLKERIFEFQKKVEETYQNESRERFALKEQLGRMFEISDRMSAETTNLTKALKGDVKMQGNWGEIVLARLLEGSGLREGEEYITQGRDLKMKDEEGKRQMPDVIINLPEGKHLIVDSKVSLLHFEALSSAETKGERERFEKLFVQSVNAHIDGLAGKRYQHNEKLFTPEFVLMFFPIEAAYSMALQLDPNIFQKSWDRSIVIVGPTTLLATLKTVASLWRQERQNQNAMKIAAESGKLYDKFVGFVNDLNKVGESIKRTESIYSDAMNKMQTGRGNIISRFEKMRELGAKASKQIPAENIEESHALPESTSPSE
jgi:DNA recombination protein RmuC